MHLVVIAGLFVVLVATLAARPTLPARASGTVAARVGLVLLPYVPPAAVLGLTWLIETGALPGLGLERMAHGLTLTVLWCLAALLATTSVVVGPGTRRTLARAGAVVAAVLSVVLAPLGNYQAGFRFSPEAVLGLCGALIVVFYIEYVRAASVRRAR